MLGRFSPARLYDLLDALAAGEGAQLFELVEQLAEYVPDYAFVLGELLTLLHQIALRQTVDKAATGEVHDEARLQDFAARLTPQDVQLWYQIGLVGRRDMPWAPDQRQALEMTLIRMLAFTPLGGAAGSLHLTQGAAAVSATAAAAPSNASTAHATGAPAAGKAPAADKALSLIHI